MIEEDDEKDDDEEELKHQCLDLFILEVSWLILW